MSRPTRGFTLTELLITLAIFAVLLMLALPSMHNWVKRQQLQNAVDDLADTLKLARHTAITQQKKVWISIEAAGATPWQLRVSYSAAAASCNTASDISCRSGSGYSGVTLSRQGGTLPLSFAFSPLRGMPEDSSGAPLSELVLNLGKTGCSNGSVTLLVTGPVFGSTAACS